MSTGVSNQSNADSLLTADLHASQIDPHKLGTMLGIFSAVMYTGANLCLRELTDCDPAWVSCIKAVPTSLVAGVLLLRNHLKGALWKPTSTGLMLLIGSGICTQVIGNVGWQWGLGIIGLALSAPLCFGAIIVAGATIGRFWLSERLTHRATLSIAILVTSIFVLSLGAGTASQSFRSSSVDTRDDLDGDQSLTPRDAARFEEKNASPQTSGFAGWIVGLGVLATCLSGVAYAAQGAILRKSVSGSLPRSTALFILSTTGMITLGSFSLVRLGPEELLATRSSDLFLMLAAGVCNAFAFFALAGSLQLMTTLQVNAINSTQIAMGVVAGVLVKNESCTPSLFGGTALCIVGVMLMQRRPSKTISVESATADAPPIE